MEKTHIILAISLLFFLPIYSQINKNILVEYTVKRGETENKERLIASSTKSIYIMDSLFFERDKNVKYAELNKETNNIVINQKTIKINASTYYKSLNSDIIYFTYKRKGLESVIKDSVPKLKWKLIQGETKKINNFSCNKATLNYRGSKLVAYYTSEIPISFGPWKFKGLPGLILEVYNVSEGATYHWVANRVLYPYSESVNFNYIENKDIKVITMEDYVGYRDGVIREKMKVMSARIPQGVNLIEAKYQRTGIEKVFEWEN